MPLRGSFRSSKGNRAWNNGYKGDIAPEVAKKIATSESMGVTPMTSDVIPPKNAFTRGLTQDAEGPFLGLAKGQSNMQRGVSW